MDALNGRAVTAWTLVVPVKHTSTGKSRLAPFVGRHRPELARAMTLDTLQAALASTAVGQIVVVTRDSDLAVELDALGIDVIPDEPDTGLNPALLHGAGKVRNLRPLTNVAAMNADLPALRPAELTRALDAASSHTNAFVADADGIGTTLYTSGAGAPFTPQFGPQSRAAHQATGAIELDLPDIASIRRDVDTESDLSDALALGIGVRTREVLASVGALL